MWKRYTGKPENVVKNKTCYDICIPMIMQAMKQEALMTSRFFGGANQ